MDEEYKATALKMQSGNNVRGLLALIKQVIIIKI